MSTSFKYLTNTWLVSQLFYPFVFYLYEGFLRHIWQVDSQLIMLVIPFAFIFSICSYLLCFLFLIFLKFTAFSVKLKFYLWIAAIISFIPLGVYFTCGYLGNLHFFSELKFFYVPGIIAAILSALFRYEQFIIMANSTDLSKQPS